MPRVKAGNIQMNYEQQGTGDPLILIPYLSSGTRLLCLRHRCLGGNGVRGHDREGQ